MARGFKGDAREMRSAAVRFAERLLKTNTDSFSEIEKKIFSDFTRLLHEEASMAFIVHPIEPKAFNPRVQGYEPIPDGMMRFKNVWLK